jgi:hypothetical protein
MFDSKRHGSGGDEEATLGLEEALVAVGARLRYWMWSAMAFLNVFQSA